MFTCVIDIHGGLANFESTAPFLYPLNDRIHVVPLSENKYTEIQEAAFYVRKFLERHIIIQWQAVFLVDLAICHDNPLVGSLTYYLYAIKEKFLDPLKEVHLNPREIIILAVDSVERNRKGRPLNPDIALRWEIDTRGYQSDSKADNFIITNKEILKLNYLWDKEISITNEKFGLGHYRSSEKLQNKFKIQYKKLENGINDLIKKKKDQLSKSKFKTDNVTNRFILESLQKIKSEFLKRVQQTLFSPDSPDAIDKFTSSDVLKDVIKNYIGINSEHLNKEFSLIRFPFLLEQPQDFEKCKIELTFLLIAISETDLVSRLNRLGNYKLEIDMDHKNAYFSELLYDYRKCLQINSEELKERFKNPAAAKLSLIRFNAKINNDKFLEEIPEGIKFKFFLDNDAVNRLNDWKNKVIDSVENIYAKCHERIYTCMEQYHKTKITGTHEDIIDIRIETQILKNKYLSQQIIPFPDEDFDSFRGTDFDSSMDKRERKIKNELNCRPSKNQFLFISTSCFVMLYLSVLFYLNNIVDFLIWGVVSLLSVVVAGFFCCFKFYKRISMEIGKIISNSHGVILKIHEKFERQKEYLLKLFNVTIAHKNYLEAEKVRQKKQEEIILSNFHMKELDLHFIIANKLCELYSLQNNSYKGLERENFCDLDLGPGTPIFRNNIYSPASFKKNPSKHEYRIGVDEVCEVQNSCYIFTMDKINFKKDNVYPRVD